MSSLTQLVQGFEGWNPKAYGDYKQYSVGYGTKARYPGEVIDKAEGERRLQSELNEARGYVTKRFPGLAPNQADALTSFTYNLGPGWMNQPTRLRAALEAGDTKTAASVMREYNKAGGAVLPGLVKRRDAEARLFLGDGVTPDQPAQATAAGPIMASGRKYTPEEVIQGRYQFANQLWREPQASPHWASVLAEGLKGVGSGLARSGAEEALTGNRDMTEEAMRNAANAPDNVTMAKLLLGSGVPDLGKQGMNLIVQDRKAAADRAADFDQRKKLMELQGEQNLAQARAMAPIEQEKAAAIARVRGQIDRENAEAILPHEVKKAKDIAAAKSELEAAERAALRRERAAYAQQHGLKGRDLITFTETGKLEKAPSRQLSVTDMTKLEEEGQKFSDLKSFAETFKDDYAGYKVGGSTLTGLARIGLPTASKESASYWQGYDRFKNVVRNNLFGAALTRAEMEAFEKADINPNMDPAIIKKNLELQQKIVTNGMRRKAQALILQGYEPRVVAATYGIDLRKDLGIDEDGNTVEPAKTPPPPDAARPDPKQPVKVNSPEEARKLPPGTPIILPDGTPGRVPGGKP